MSEERKKCNRCKVNLLLKDYKLKRDGLYSKNCFQCLDGFAKTRNKIREKNKDKFECKECDKKFNTNGNLQCHIKQVHLKIKDFECEQCDMKFSTNGDLQRHIKRVHLKIKDFECKECDYKCSGNDTLQRHIKSIHLKIKDFECDQCDYKCSTNSNLQKHIKQVHLKIKDFECDQCDYNFSNNSTLQRHIKQVHLKIKDFECDQCDYTCSNNSNLQQHIKMVHDKIKDFGCEQCDMKFSTNGNLQRHIKMVHLKIKDFECEHCDYTCNTNGNLQRHIQTCTGTEHISSGEYQVRECLQEMNIDFQHNTSYVVKDIQLLHWDFILYKNDEVQAFIEYDGRQHFIPSRFGGISVEQAEENLRTSQQRDKIKDDFCKENNYPLLRIPYTEFGNIPQMITEFCVEHLDWGYE